MRIPASQLHAINDCGVTACGFILNGLLIWLILNKSANEMKIYKRILLQTCFIDMAFLTFIGIVQPMYFVQNGWHMMASVGPLRAISYPWNFMLLASWFYMLHFSISANCVPFIYRYLVICKSKVISSLQYFLMLVACALLIAVYICLLIWSLYPHEAQRNQINNTALVEMLGVKVDNHSQFHIGVMTKSHSIPWALTCTYALTTHTISYSIIFTCGLKIRKFVHSRSQTARAYELYRQLSYVLILQASMPVFELSTLLFSLISSNIVTDSKVNVYATDFTIMPLHWVPLLNSLVTIWVIKPYRKFITCSARKAIHPTSSVSGLSNYKFHKTHVIVF